ncbi:nucleotidyltransferase domain-containing protein [Clostridium neuense]|uniref:Nucleotidyltransferase domain-containing protein n=1 Tax=Clostridium neuense TaxID=1728934 RepID=A0ABW8THA4_9CLOT
MTVWNFLDKVKKYAEENDMINAVVLVGSYARGEEKEDSDVDLTIISTTPKLLIEDAEFVNDFGKLIKVEKENYGRVTSIRAWYEDGMEVEFGITSPLWISKPLDEGTLKVLKDGYKVILDKKNYFTHMNII